MYGGRDIRSITKIIVMHSFIYLFLRNSHRYYLDLGWLENVSERLRTSLEIGEDTLPIPLFVIGRSGICVLHSMAKSIVKEDCDLSSGRCDRFCFSDPGRQAAVRNSPCRRWPRA